jgi:hypothetical protein
MARPAATPSDSRSQDRRMQPNRAAARFVPGPAEQISKSSELRGLALATAALSSPHQRVVADSSQPPPACPPRGSNKNPAGGAPQRGIAARTRKGGSPFHRADFSHPAIKNSDGRFASRTLGTEKIAFGSVAGRQGGHLRRRVKGAWTEILGPQLSACAAGTRTLCGSCGGCPGPGSVAAHREHPKAD